MGVVVKMVEQEETIFHERTRKAGISGPQRDIGVYISLDFSRTWDCQLWSAGLECPLICSTRELLKGKTSTAYLISVCFTVV